MGIAKYRGLLCFLILSLTSSFGFAAQELLVRGEIKVYAQPSTGSEVLTTLEQGERVPISPNDYGKFKKVLVRAGGKKRTGYILKTDTQGSRLRTRKGEGSRNRNVAYHQRYGLGISPVISYTRQGAWNINSDGFVYEMSALSGVAAYLGINFEIPIDPSIAIRLELNFRKTNNTGTIKPTGAQAQTVQRTVTFLGAGATAKYYFESDGDFWIGGGAEIAHANEVSLIYANADKVNVSSSDYPTYFILKAAVGQDFNLSGDLFLNPEARVAMALNTSPMVIGVEFAANLSYAF